MEHGLASIGAGIHNHPVPSLGNPLFLCQFFGYEKQLPHQINIVGGQFIHR